MKYLIAVSAVLFVIALVLSLQGKEAPLSEPTSTTEETTETYNNTEFGLSFTYRTGSEGYVLDDRSFGGDSEGPLHAIILTPTASSGNIPEGGEGPATISIEIYKNTDRDQAGNWAVKNDMYSSVNLATSPVASAVVGGANAVRYMADGLYASEKVVVTHAGYVYVFTGAFLDADSSLRKDFAPLLASVNFIEIPEPAVSGKIDVSVVCEGALMYMTFTDGAAADAFVAECKEGKHPEVIERFKESLNLGEGVAI